MNIPGELSVPLYICLCAVRNKLETERSRFGSSDCSTDEMVLEPKGIFPFSLDILLAYILQLFMARVWM